MRLRSTTPLLFAILATNCAQYSTQSRAPGQPTMNELMHRRAAQRKTQAEQYQAREDVARSLAPDQVSQMESALASAPEDFPTRETLLMHYRFKRDILNRDKHLLWLIEHDRKTA